MLSHKSKICRQFAALALMAVAAAIFPACATLTSDATNEQRYFETKSQWNTVLAGAVVFAQSPAGQDRPEVIRKLHAVAIRVGGVLLDLDISMCYVGVPTISDPAPPPADTCVPLSGDAASRRFNFVSRVLLVAIPEITALLTSAR